MKSEKWAIFAILTFILIIAAFNVIGSLSMLIIEKKKDAGVMRTLGADLWTIKKIFLTEGASISIIGALTGLALGGLVCWAQMEFSIIKIQNTVSMSAMAYPVEMQIFDFGAVLITVFCIGLLAALYPVRHISTEYISESLIKEG